MTDFPKISVCVPAYERPAMLRQLANSFLRQDYPEKELIISDDSRSNAVEQMLMQLPSPLIRYTRNDDNLGYSRNLRRSMELATGDYVLLMGDDDMFLRRSALRRYVDAFIGHPHVAYIACNKVQFNSELRVEYIYQQWHADKVFAAGRNGLRGIWLSSVFIPGMAMRREQILAYYPGEEMLFPQVEAVGRLLLEYDGMGLAYVGIAGRAHSGQLGFEAIVGRGTKGNEGHGTQELLHIFDRLSGIAPVADLRRDFLEPELVRQYRTMMLKERTIVPARAVLHTYRTFCTNSLVARSSQSLRASAFVAAVTPPSAIAAMRVVAIAIYRRRRFAEISTYESALRAMAEAHA